MKKTFLAKRNALLSVSNFSWGAFALAFSVLVLFVRLLAPNFFLYATTPVFMTAQFVTTYSNTFFSSFSDAAALATRNEQLERENAALINENKALIEKTVTQNALLGSPNAIQNNAPGIFAGVISRPPESPYDTLVLSAGSNEGVMLGYGAFGEGGVPLGLVSSVTADFSRVTLFSTPGIVVHGWIGKAHLPLSILGAGAGTLEASISRSAEVVLGDTVWAPGPGLLPLGVVTRIDSDPSSPGVTLLITPNTNPFSLTWVLLRDTGKSLKDAFSLATSTLP